MTNAEHNLIREPHDIHVEIYGSPSKMLASVVLSLLIAFILLGASISAVRHRTPPASVGSLIFVVCVGVGYISVIAWSNRLTFKRLAENSRDFFRGRPIYVLTPEFIKFLDVFELRIDEIVDVREVDLVTGGIPGYGRNVIVLSTRSEIHLDGNALERHSYEKKIEMLLSTARKRNLDLSDRRIAIMDLAGTNFGAQEAYA